MMSPDQIASMAQITLRARLPTGPYDRADIAKAADDCAKMLKVTLSDGDREWIVRELETRLVVKIGRATTLSDQTGHVPWYVGERKKDRRFFQRYVDFLKQVEGWPAASVDAVDDATDTIMEWLEDPVRDGPWDRRGLVVGDVQSGKTANYAGLMCKAADAGYKLIIVLAGMHKVLRKQTQQRLDRDFLGYDTTSNLEGSGFKVIGVGKIDGSIHAEYATTQDINGDFNANLASSFGVGVQQRPVLLVVKKNASILKNLNSWVSDVLRQLGDTETRPLLVIDDEADQASVDTGEQDFEDDVPDPDYDPKTINGQIRKLLLAFTRSAYVAYTATPFANILIHDAAEATEYGKDLFPAAFIVNLPTPSNYIGPNLVFGIDANQGARDEDPLPVIRDVDQAKEGWITINHKKTFLPTYEGEQQIPPSLEEAILSFILVCAARIVRGQATSHNSMLIHVSRFTDVQRKVFDQVDAWLGDVKRALRHNTGAEEILGRLKKLWLEDFEPTSAEIRSREIGKSLQVTSWSAVQASLADASEKIRVQVVNSESPDVIPYDAHKDSGLSIIAVGGDKLSRGLTLEGLSVRWASDQNCIA
jgi:Z1 domain